MRARDVGRRLSPPGGMRRRLAAFGRDRSGAVAIFVAVVIIPLVGALGLATDAARGYMVKARLQQALDAAALAGGKAMFSPHRDEDVRMFFEANFPPGFMGATVSPLRIEVDPTSTYITVSAEATIETTFTRVLGFETLTVAASTEVTRTVDQLDLVLSIDMSGSMCDPCSKIEAARDAALTLVDILFGINPDGSKRTESPTIEVDGRTYDLLNIGLVTWNAKTNVTLNESSFTGSRAQSVPPFVNPVTGQTQNVVYYANNSPVPLLSDPLKLPGGWSGCVYARYLGDFDDANGNGEQDWNEAAINDNDADLLLGPVRIGGKDWIAWEPVGVDEGEPRNGWAQCHQSYWNDDDAGVPSGVPPPPSPWYPAVPRISDWNSDCSVCLSHGITPLQSRRAPIEAAIASLTSPEGNTNIPQGLHWAWEVLMPGEPFDEALETVPFPRQRAIVLLTDGEIVGGNGDAYKGRFGSGNYAGRNTRAEHGFLPSPPAAPGTRNNLNNRLIQLAANIKAMGIRLYVIQFDNDTAALTTLLKTVASEPREPFYYYAPNEAALREAFRQVANNLSKLRLSK